MNPADFIAFSKEHPILDARSPSEFAEGHIANALSLPLFTDDQRSQVGTTYKQKGRDKAVKLGLDLIGPSLRKMVEQAESLSKDRKVGLYCWRGGMRSGSLAWLLRTTGFEVQLLEGGYKAYRNWMYEQFDAKWKLITVGGMTGAGKTEVLMSLEKRGEQIIDLEGIAKHKGSAFGNLENLAQPTVEHFQNALLHELMKLDPSKPIWVEDESQHIGRCWINDQFFAQIKSAPLVFVERDLKERVEHLANQYGSASKENLKAVFDKIAKRLGGQNVKLAHELLEQGEIHGAAEIALRYYDKSYGFMIENRQVEKKADIQGSGLTFDEIAEALISLKNELQGEAHLV